MGIEKNASILLTGGNGFLGKVVYDKLNSRGYENLFKFGSSNYDLTKENDVEKLFSENGPFDVVIHMAALVGGIGFNKENPGKIYYDNLMMNTLVQEYARRNKVKKFVGIGSVCSYPKFTPVPFKEEDLWEGYPEETNAPYGLSKKSMMVQSQAYSQQYGFNAIHLTVVNLYGPRDNFDPASSHVIPAIIKKVVEAKEEKREKISMWGTGKASREFLYVDDAAEGIISAMEKHNQPNPINLGAGMEITIKDLTNKIVEILNYTGEIEWDASKPDGQPRRCLEVSKAEKEFGFRSKTGFDEGLRKTIEWYLENKN